jgi:glycogen(starch) synthase
VGCGRPLRIALLTLKFLPLLGGDVTHVLHLGRFLAEHGVEVDIITVRPVAAAPDLPLRGLRVHRLGLPATTTELETVGVKRILYMVSSLLLLFRLLHRRELGLIHAHGWDPALVGGLFSRVFRVPLVLTVHGVPRPGHPLRRVVFQIMERLLLWLCSSRYSRIVALTVSDAAELIRLGAPRDRIDVIPNGIDAEEFRGIEPGGFREEHGIPAGAFLALFVGRLHEQKGVEVLLRAAARLRGSGIVFVVVGSGHEEAGYLRLARELGVEETVFTGEIARADLLRAFASCDAFVLPSIFEGMPYVLLEAMAAGKPVVASRLPGIAGIVQDGRTGILFEKGDDEALAHAVLRLKHDRGLAGRMGEAGRRLIDARLDWRVVFTRTMETYRIVLGKGCPGGG